MTSTEPSILAQAMSNQFGNYMCQKIIEECSEKELRAVLLIIKSDIFQISTSVHGTRAMQTLAEVLSKHQDSMGEDIKTLIRELEGRVSELSTHPHGNHVIQAILLAFRSSEKPADEDVPGSKSRSQFTDFIFEACKRDCKTIGMHKHGCCVMQRCLEKGSRAQKFALADVIIKHLTSLIEDPYGNYLV